MVLTSNAGVDSPVALTLDVLLPIPAYEAALDPPPKRLSDRHLEELRASGISDQVIRDSRIRSAPAEMICWMLHWPRDREQVGTGWTIPFDDPDLEDCYWRVKLDEPRDADGRLIKYESPIGSSNRAFLPPGFDASDGVPIVITEGEKKALSAISHGINCLGLTGCWNWQQPRTRDDTGRAYGQRQLIDDLARITWAKRDVTICFDSDAAEKRSVELAQQRLAEALAKRGASVRVARLPHGAEGAKLGLDDAIVELGIDAVQNILDAAVEPELPKLFWPDLARLLIEETYSWGTEPTLRYWRDAFWRWTGRHYEEVRDNVVSNEAYRFLERIAWEPTRHSTREILAALQAELEVDDRLEPPCSLDLTDASLPGTPLMFANQIAFVDFDGYQDGDQLVGEELSPGWFCLGSRDYDVDPSATCPAWETFLASSLPDADARRLLQQWFGYLLSNRMDHHKLMVLLGAMRAGKSIIADTMARIVGQSATATSTLKALGGEFGLWPLLGKQLLLIPDAQDRGSCLGAVERLKTISGCDGLGVNRKHQSILNDVHLPTRIVVTCNQLPRFLDPSGALHRRLLLVSFEISFAGREDLSLPARIQKELPGIFNWALRGWVDLRDTRRFVEPLSSQAVLAEAEHVLSPISAFVDECCDVAPNVRVTIDELWGAWQSWCKYMGHQPGSRAKLGTDLRGYLPGIQRNQLRVNGRPMYHYQGLELNNNGRALGRDWRLTAICRA